MLHLLFTLPECPPLISLAHPAPNPVKKQRHSFPVSSPLESCEVYEFSVINDMRKKKVENPGIDTDTSRMRSGRSTI